jgi:uncharacterized protein (DUF1800 family)
MNRLIYILHKSAAAAAIFTILAPSMIVRSNWPPAAALTEEQRILQVLSRLGFGARPGDVARVRSVGLKKYIDQQLDPASIDDSATEARVQGLDVFNKSTAELFATYPNPNALLRQLDGRNRNSQSNEQAEKKGETPAVPDQAEQRERREKIQELYRQYDLKPAGQIVPQIVANRVIRAVYSQRQLQEVMVDFWQNHFNVYAGKAAVRWYIPSYERDVLRKNALGNFKDLLVGTAQHPAMLFFLDNFESVSPDAQATGNNVRLQQLINSGGDLPQRMRDRLKRQYGVNDAQLDLRLKEMRTGPRANQQAQKRGLNENYARELLELHTLGVDNGYTQKDIIEVAKCFTGWTIADARGYRKAAAGVITGDEERRMARAGRQMGASGDVESGEFYFNPRWHANGAKSVMGQKIDEGGIKDGLKVLDILANSQATARFIARKLAVKFVSDNPSEALIGRVAETFHRTGGDIRSTLRTLFSDEEFFAPQNYRAKIKTPFELVVSSIRTLGAQTNGGPAMLGMLNKLGEVPYGYQAPTGYPDTAEDWVNTGALLERLNFAIAFASNRIPGTAADLKDLGSTDKAVILDKAIAMILDNEISPETKAILKKQILQPLPDVKGLEMSDAELDVTNMRGPGEQGGGRNRQTRLLQPSGNPDVFKIVSLVLGTPEFQRQ